MKIKSTLTITEIHDLLERLVVEHIPKSSYTRAFTRDDMYLAIADAAAERAVRDLMDIDDSDFDLYE